MKFTKKMYNQLDSLRDNASTLPKPLKEFAQNFTYDLLITGNDYPSRAALQRHIDTLIDLIDVKVNSL